MFVIIEKPYTNSHILSPLSTRVVVETTVYHYSVAHYVWSLNRTYQKRYKIPLKCRNIISFVPLILVIWTFFIDHIDAAACFYVHFCLYWNHYSIYLSGCWTHIFTDAFTNDNSSSKRTNRAACSNDTCASVALQTSSCLSWEQERVGRMDEDRRNIFP